MKCPICKKDALFVGVHDDEGNYHGLVGCDYESNPWSGLSYGLHHDGWGECPLCTDGVYSTMGGILFDTAEEAIATLTPQNEWVSVEERLPPNMDDVIKEFGITKSMFHDRKHKGWNLDEIASTPKNAIGGYRPKGVRVYHG